VAPTTIITGKPLTEDESSFFTVASGTSAGTETEASDFECAGEARSLPEEENTSDEDGTFDDDNVCEDGSWPEGAMPNEGKHFQDARSPRDREKAPGEGSIADNENARDDDVNFDREKTRDEDRAVDDENADGPNGSDEGKPERESATERERAEVIAWAGISTHSREAAPNVTSMVTRGLRWTHSRFGLNHEPLAHRNEGKTER
jgi:hypothetical protein